MRRVLAIATSSAMLLALMGCGSSELNAETANNETAVEAASIEDSTEISNETTDTESSPESEAATVGEMSEDTITYQGKSISVLSDTETTLATLGEPTPKLSQEYFDDDGNSQGNTYGYSDWGISIETINKDNNEMPLTIKVSNPEIKTSRNVGVLSTEAEVIAAYGEPEENKDGLIKYTLGDLELIFYMDQSDTPLVSEVVYMNKTTSDSITWS